MGGHVTGPKSCILQFATTNTRGGVGRQAWSQVARRAITNATQRASDSSDTEHQSAAAPPTPASILQPLVQGKRFTCTGCADCCTGKVASGEVWLNDAEGAAIALHLGISFDAFLQRYTKNYARRPGWRLLKLKGGCQDCIFLKDKLCTIYGVRPLQCSTYPWWPELMGDAAWHAEAAACEGIEHAEAPPLVVADAAAQLGAAAVYFAEFEAADSRADGTKDDR